MTYRDRDRDLQTNWKWNKLGLQVWWEKQSAIRDMVWRKQV